MGQGENRMSEEEGTEKGEKPKELQKVQSEEKDE